MKRFFLYILLLFPTIVFGQQKDGIILFEKPDEIMNIKSFKVSHAMDQGFALATALSETGCRDHNGLIVLLFQKGKYFYDEEPVTIPYGKKARQIGVYKYTVFSEQKTVPVIQIMGSEEPISIDKSIIDKKTIEDSAKVYDVVEQMPSFPGGSSALFEYLANNIIYPVDAENNGIQGRVVCTFVVEKDGSITHICVASSVFSSLDEEAIRVIANMPKWIPGRQNGSTVRVKYTVPVTFRLH